MLWTIFVILLVLWLLGMVTSYTLGGFIHIGPPVVNGQFLAVGYQWCRGRSILTPIGKPPPLAVRLAQALPFRRAQGIEWNWPHDCEHMWEAIFPHLSQ